LKWLHKELKGVDSRERMPYHYQIESIEEMSNGYRTDVDEPELRCGAVRE
jgi:hypothetical protein